MTRGDLIRQIQSKVKNRNSKDVDIQVRDFFNTIKAALSNGYNVEIRGFGRFITKEHKAREIINPKNGKNMFIKARKVPFFKSGKIQEIFNQPTL